ncbi:GAF and ANTAR domain-containing protein [Nocardia sp. NPDC050717]|uniref:GAF and ANTAR domain-containing protein n=1 Tax=Nocardia sp. NPDC050717 TaxID=3157221 RepID=UPI0034023703
MGDSVEDAFQRRPDEPRHHGGAEAAGDSLVGGVGLICSTAVRLTATDGCAVALLSARSSARELVYATDATAQRVDELQFVVGEGPCLEAYRTDRPQLWPDMSARGTSIRWPAFTAEVVALGVQAIYAFPVPGNGSPLGVLELHRGTAGDLSAAEEESGMACATAIGRLLESDVDRLAVAAELEDPGLVIGADDEFSRALVFNASGMVAVQLAVSAEEGLARLRAYCFATGRPIGDVAADIVARRLSLRGRPDAGEGQGA